MFFFLFFLFTLCLSATFERAIQTREKRGEFRKTPANQMCSTDTLVGVVRCHWEIVYDIWLHSV